VRQRPLLDEAAVNAIANQARARLAPVEPWPRADSASYFAARRTEAGRKLPPYYLVYFLLVDLLGFPHGGQSEKVDWSVPVRLGEHRFFIEHRKFGLGIFGSTSPEAEAAAERIAACLHRGVKAARPYFAHLAASALDAGELNVLNVSNTLFGRYEFLRRLLEQRRGDLQRVEQKKPKPRELAPPTVNEAWFDELSAGFNRWNAFAKDRHRLRTECGWLTQSMIEAFFAWTEHIFVHIAILQGNVRSGEELKTITAADWSNKFKAALDITCPHTAKHFSKLTEVRREYRNFTSHGAFGKDGQAFEFHSDAGAVPLRFDSSGKRSQYTLLPSAGVLEDAQAVAAVGEFVAFLQTGANEPIWYFLEAELPTVLPYGITGLYKRVLSSMDDTRVFISQQASLQEQAWNMDW